MEVAGFLVIYIAWGLICMVMATNRGRNKYLGLAAGLFLGFLGIIYYWIAGPTEEKRIEKAKELVKKGGK